jgi:hypothetical protein
MDGDVGTVASEEVTLDSALLEKVRGCFVGMYSEVCIAFYDATGFES